jgi:hypothetical protein
VNVDFNQQRKFGGNPVATIEKAIEIAATAHAGVKDKQGKPYLLHPIRVMMDVEDGDAQIVAVLHDVVEDTDVSIDDIRSQGFSNDVVDALNLVTHRKNQPYSEYVIACKQNQISRQVKLSDLRDNTNLGRVLLRPCARWGSCLPCRGTRQRHAAVSTRVFAWLNCRKPATNWLGRVFSVAVQVFNSAGMMPSKRSHPPKLK